MSGKDPLQLKSELQSLGWECRESQPGDRWTIMVTQGGKSIVATGKDRQLVWNAAYRDAIKQSS